MTKFRHYRHSLLLLALAIVCASGNLCAQEDQADPSAVPIIVDHKQASALIVMQSAPEYPPIAKANYIQGHVKVKLTVNGKGKVASAHVLKGDALLAAVGPESDVALDLPSAVHARGLRDSLPR